MRMHIHLFLFSALLVCLTCKRDQSAIDHDQLSISRNDYFGNEIQTKGYYVKEANGAFFSATFFYRNGVIIASGGSEGSLSGMDEYIRREFLANSNFKNSRLFFGVFLVDNEIVKFEHWYPSSGGPLKTYVREGFILNDSSFVITQSYRNQNGKKTEVTNLNELYKFRRFSPKPDSTNNYIK